MSFLQTNYFSRGESFTSREVTLWVWFRVPNTSRHSQRTNMLWNYRIFSCVTLQHQGGSFCSVFFSPYLSKIPSLPKIRGVFPTKTSHYLLKSKKRALSFDHSAFDSWKSNFLVATDAMDQREGSCSQIEEESRLQENKVFQETLTWNIPYLEWYGSWQSWFAKFMWTNTCNSLDFLGLSQMVCFGSWSPTSSRSVQTCECGEEIKTWPNLVNSLILPLWSIFS